MERYGIMFMFFVGCCLVVQGSAKEYLGCTKLNTTQKICKQESGLTTRETSLANTIEWLRQQQSDGLWFNSLHVTGLVTSQLAVAGYVNDADTCSETFETSKNKILSLFENDDERVNDLNGGQLALVILGMKANCMDPRQIGSRDLVEVLVQKMKNFPEQSFNNYYQYSLGIIALASTGTYVEDSFLRNLLANVFLGSGSHKKGDFASIMNDTRLMGVLALQAAHRQKFHPHWYAKHGNRELRRAHKAVKHVLKKFEEIEKNLVTVAHFMQVLFSFTDNLQKVPGCGKMYKWLIQHQNEAGSYGGIAESAYVLPALAGKSLLDVMNIDCEKKKDDVSNASIQKFVASRKISATKEENFVKEASSLKFIVVTVNLHYDNLQTTETVHLREGSTAFDALLKAADVNNCFRATYTKTVWGPMIESICGESADHISKTYWMFYFGNEKAKTGPSKCVLKTGDAISFKLEKWVG